MLFLRTRRETDKHREPKVLNIINESPQPSNPEIELWLQWEIKEVKFNSHKLGKAIAKETSVYVQLNDFQHLKMNMLVALTMKSALSC